MDHPVLSSEVPDGEVGVAAAAAVVAVPEEAGLVERT